MSKVKFNPFLEKLSGSFGDIVFRRVGDRVVLAHKPDLHGVERTPAQLAQQERFRHATQYAQITLADPLTRQPYQQAFERTGQPVFSIAVGDYLAAPQIEELDLAAYTGTVGSLIAVRAHDDFEVTGVQVRLLDTAGTEIEKGPALQQPAGSGRWVYTARSAVAPGSLVRVEVGATDRPGNRAEQSAEKTV